MGTQAARRVGTQAVAGPDRGRQTAQEQAKILPCNPL
jgi:hypothetical protein